jgi:hypothetical protein
MDGPLVPINTAPAENHGSRTTRLVAEDGPHPAVEVGANGNSICQRSSPLTVPLACHSQQSKALVLAMQKRYPARQVAWLTALR